MIKNTMTSVCIFFILNVIKRTILASYLQFYCFQYLMVVFIRTQKEWKDVHPGGTHGHVLHAAVQHIGQPWVFVCDVKAHLKDIKCF